MKKIIAMLCVLTIMMSVCVFSGSAADDMSIERRQKTELAAVGAGITKLNTVEPLSNGNRVKWVAFSGAAKYRVFIKSGGSWKKLADTKGTYYHHTAAKVNTTYVYTVRAMNAKGKWVSAYDKTGIKFCRRAAPSISKLENIAGGVKVTIKLTKGVSQAAVFVKGGTFGGSWKRLKYGGSSISVSITKGNGGNKLSFAVRAADSSGKYTSVMSGGKAFTIYDAPTLKMSVVSGGQKLTVNKTAGAYNYRIFIRSSGKWQKLADTKSDYTNKNVTLGKTYLYTVRAMDYYGKFISGYYTGGFSLQYLANPTITRIENVAYGQRIYWNKISGATFYRLYYKAPYDTGWQFAVDSNRNYADFEMGDGDEGVTFTYTLRAMDERGNFISSYDAKGKEAVYCGTPKILYFENSRDEGISMEIYLPQGVKKGRLFLKDGSTWQPYADFTGDEYVFENPQMDRTYVFTVRGIDNSGNYITPYDDDGWVDTYSYLTPREVDYDTVKQGLQQICTDAGMRYREDVDAYADHLLIAYTGVYGENTGNINDLLIERGRKAIAKYLDKLDSFNYKPGEYKFKINVIEYDEGEAFFVLVAQPI